MKQTTLLDEINEFRNTQVLPKISDQIPVSSETIKDLGKQINRFVERSTQGQEQILLAETRELLASIPRAEAAKYRQDASRDYV